MELIEKRELICIGCPMGCPLTVTIEQQTMEQKAAGQKTVTQVTGHTCPKGKAYAEKEVTNPTRIVTSTVMVEGGTLEMVSVKTKSDIPKGKMAECVDSLRGICVKAPVHIGDVIAADIAGTGVDIVATKEVPAGF